MKCVLLSLFLTGAVVSAPTALDLTPALNVLGEVSAPLQSTATFQAKQDEVHAVVVDMPEVVSLVYASPETWGVYRCRLNHMTNLRQHQCSSLPRTK